MYISSINFIDKFNLKKRIYILYLICGYLRNKNVIFFQIMKNIVVAKNWASQNLIFELWENLFWSYISPEPKIAPREPLNYRARIWIRARSRACALSRLGGASCVDGRSRGCGRLQSCRNGRRERWQSGWVVGNESVVCVHARATDAIQPTCEEACVKKCVVMTFAWVAISGD